MPALTWMDRGGNGSAGDDGPIEFSKLSLGALERSRRYRVLYEMNNPAPAHTRSDTLVPMDRLRAPDENSYTPVQKREIFSRACVVLADSIEAFFLEYLEREFPGTNSQWNTAREMLCKREGVPTGDINGCDPIITSGDEPNPHVDDVVKRVFRHSKEGQTFIESIPCTQCKIKATHTPSGRWFSICVQASCDYSLPMHDRGRIILARIYDVDGRIVDDHVVLYMFNNRRGIRFSDLSNPDTLRSKALFPVAGEDVNGHWMTQMFAAGVVNAFLHLWLQDSMKLHLPIRQRGDFEDKLFQCKFKQKREDDFFTVFDPTNTFRNIITGVFFGFTRTKQERVTHVKAVSTGQDFIRWALKINPNGYPSVITVPSGIESFTLIQTMTRLLRVMNELELR
jgi:hypothetical protein